MVFSTMFVAELWTELVVLIWLGKTVLEKVGFQPRGWKWDGGGREPLEVGQRKKACV